nr:arylamine N-acetyltransferase [uncultured Aminipila sp.]
MIDEDFKLSEKQMESYLSRLGVNKMAPTVENLKKLQTIHISKIPYENLSILMGEPISLNGSDLFHKIIKNKRGGYCFEVNGLYNFFLKALGYKVTTYNCRFIFEHKDVQIRRHRILKVDFSNVSYITDVSFRNEFPRCAMKFICDEVQSDGISKYKFTKDSYYGYVMWQKRTGKDWTRIFGFDESPQSEIDFFLPNYYCETHPESPFITCAHMSICPINQHITIEGRTLVISEKDNILEKQMLKTKDEFMYVCKEYFNIDINDKMIALMVDRCPDMRWLLEV